MARLSRLVLPGFPYHVTQRGNRRSQTFFEDRDYELYRGLPGEAAQRACSDIWCYCQVPSHLHVLVEPSGEDPTNRDHDLLALSATRLSLLGAAASETWVSG